MAKPKPRSKTDLSSYTIAGTDKVVKAGDCVLLRPPDAAKPPYVARVERIEADARVQIRWYYRPDEAVGGRRVFHGSKELFLTDHYDTQSADTIQGKCVVHTFKDYKKLANVGAPDYFCRFEYTPSTGAFRPDRVAVYCKCELPYNPDSFMVRCDKCKDWFHPSCIGMTMEQAKRSEHFRCSDCSSDDGGEKGVESLPALRASESKVNSKRRK